VSNWRLIIELPSGFCRTPQISLFSSFSMGEGSRRPISKEKPQCGKVNHLRH
jgi:hypothetical protein